MSKSHFSKQTLQFLARLARNNEREWFKSRKAEYEAQVLDPLLRFVTDFEEPLKKISPHYCASAKKVGGSVFRIHRDVRFSKNKAPYKTWAAARFRHEAAPAHPAPSFYLHIQPKNCFLAAGMWHPASATLNRLRQFLADNPRAWKEAIGNPRFKRFFELSGRSLKRPPRGFRPDDPLIDDLKRKDFIAVTPVSDDDVVRPQFLKKVADRYGRAGPFVDYLCAALDLDF